ncbi:putative ubiquitin-conjugating enzyme E2 [Cafeteria roenbergensis virus]|uniref:E2 ubiquitin-conjugating enzyme n=1 Tax=Cafeteria roenbergensis virus (strain BV-PW1) TaxID=693272 RepID=E3T4M2_CROVB|nr:putative ubiquitin-conjugating enzyme E2 [Cafeteria roenbergensis virus BV-PW1]ADO67135.1 putative ubiquitin-conjugating enzyme E2 [Cafeteria roenbergensis virus BV-PW1]
MSLNNIRLTKEWELIQKDPPTYITTGPKDKTNLNLWDGTLVGPSGTPYEGGVFQLEITFPEDYPYKPPKIIFKTPIYHPNISTTGAICLDILKNNWSPALNISKVLLSLCSLLADPNPDDPLVPQIAYQFKTNYSGFRATARQLTVKYAS